jgi:hypothetical protein
MRSAILVLLTAMASTATAQELITVTPDYFEIRRWQQIAATCSEVNLPDYNGHQGAAREKLAVCLSG